MRVLFLAGYAHEAYQRKVDYLANAPEVELLQLNSSAGIPTGRRASADGQRHYTVEALAARQLGQAGDPHREWYQPLTLGLRRFRPDLIHCEFEQESLGAAQVALARRLFAPRAALTLYAYQNLLRSRRAAVRAVSALTRRAAGAVVCASGEAAEVLRRQGYRGLTPVIAGMGVDTTRFWPAATPPARARLVVGYAGRLVTEKDVATLVRAVAVVKAEAELVVAGGGPELAALTALAGTLGLGERCQFVGPVDYDAMPEFLRGLDVLVLPSRTTANWKEQFGRVLVEAMACGTVVVGSDSGAMAEVMGEAGSVFAEGDAATLARILEALAARPGRRAELRAAGLARVQAHYTVERVAAAVLALWRELAA